MLTDTQAEEQPGFTDGLLNVLEREQEPAIRLSSKAAQVLQSKFPCADA